MIRKYRNFWRVQLLLLLTSQPMASLEGSMTTTMMTSVDDYDNDDGQNDDSYEKILVTDSIVSNHSRRNNFRSSSDLA